MKKYISFAPLLLIISAVLSSCVTNTTSQDGDYNVVDTISISSEDIIAGLNEDESSFLVDNKLFNIKNYSIEEDDSLSLKNGGYITSIGAFPSIISIEVDYEANSELGRIYYKTFGEMINNPHQGNIVLNDEQEILIDESAKQNYFAIYVALGDYTLHSISISYHPNHLIEEIFFYRDIDVYAFNDFHGYVAYNADEGQPGMARHGDYLKEETSKNVEGTIILSGGDNYQGTADSNITRGALVNAYYNDIGLDASTFGNHEFDWGVDTLQRMMQGANFPYLGINIFDKTTNQRVSYAQASTLLIKNNIKVGVIGAIGNVYSSISETITSQENFTFKTSSTLTTLIRNEATALINDGAQIIIYVVHDGSEGTPSNDTYFRDFYSSSLSDVVDLVIEGHTHYSYIYEDTKGTVHMETASYGEAINHVKFSYGEDGYYVNNVETKDMSDYTSQDESLLSIYEYFEDNFIAEIRDEVLTTSLSSDLWSYAPFVEAYAKLLKTYATSYLMEEQISDDLFVGAVAQESLRAGIYKGTVLYGNLYEAMPFDNTMAIVKISGYDLLNKFINRSGRVAYIFDDVEQKIITDSSTYYYVIADSYQYDYSSNNMDVIKVLSISELTSFDSNLSKLRSDVGSDFVYPRDLARVAFLSNMI